eukprot:COSAG01_NODE_46638_length_398_cov_0.866221_1_plen_70_part_01
MPPLAVDPARTAIERPRLGKPPAPSCWNPHYDQIKQWYSQFPSFAGEGKPFTYVNWYRDVARARARTHTR